MRKQDSAAVMARRTHDRKTLDDFPTPPWATRALFEHVLHTRPEKAWEPSCNRGHMANVIKEYVPEVKTSDVFDYGYPGTEQIDFLSHFDWGRYHRDMMVITNPPFVAAEEFVRMALDHSLSCAVILRLQFAESKGRYERLFSMSPPDVIAQFVERVGMSEGKVDRKATSAMAYAWFVWNRTVDPETGDPLQRAPTEFRWIPPCRAELERVSDYR